MQCDQTPKQAVLFWISIILNGIAALLAILSIICITCIGKNLLRVLRRILISFYVSNLVGIGAITHDTLFDVCDTKLDMPLVRVSLLLTLSHLSLLFLAEYSLLTRGASKKEHHDFIGLIMLEWILSLTIGTMIIAPDQGSSIARRVFSISLVAGWLGLTILLYIVTRRYLRKKKISKMSKESFFNVHNLRRGSVWRGLSQTDQEFRLMFHFVNMLLSICCCMLWVVNEFYDFHGLRSVALLMCSCSFFFPGVFAACLWRRDLKKRKMVLPL